MCRSCHSVAGGQRLPVDRHPHTNCHTIYSVDYTIAAKEFLQWRTHCIFLSAMLNMLRDT